MCCYWETCALTDVFKSQLNHCLLENKSVNRVDSFEGCGKSLFFSLIPNSWNADALGTRPKRLYFTNREWDWKINFSYKLQPYNKSFFSFFFSLKFLRFYLVSWKGFRGLNWLSRAFFQTDWGCTLPETGRNSSHSSTGVFRDLTLASSGGGITLKEGIAVKKTVDYYLFTR